MSDLAARYRGYIACLNARDWDRLGDFVAEDAVYNGRRIGLAGYRAMLENDVATIPDLSFEVTLLVAGDDLVASRLDFHCTPVKDLFGHPPSGQKISFGENVFYRFTDGLIREVWSVIDKAAIEAQLAPPAARDRRPLLSRS